METFSMELGVLLLLAVLVATIVIRSAIICAPIPATAADWYVVFDIDAEQKVLALWFYPVVALERRRNQTIVITSRPDHTNKLAASRPPKKVNEDMLGGSTSYGRWFRDGVPLDECGNPDLQNSSDFSATVEHYLLGEFKLHLATPIPVFYQSQVQKAVEQVRRKA